MQPFFQSNTSSTLQRSWRQHRPVAVTMSSKNQVETQFDTELSLIGKHRKLIALKVHIGVMRRQIVGNGKKLEGTQQKRKSATQTAATFNPVTIVGVESQKGVGLPVGRQDKLLSKFWFLLVPTGQSPRDTGLVKSYL